ncbi:MAG: S8 family serine peptidase [Planctomycetota bacterium]|jgi:subtilisin family serine protease
MTFKKIPPLALFFLLGAVGWAEEKDSGNADKIDPRIRQILPRAKENQKIPVVLLGKTQLLEPPSGFREFCAKNKNRKRSELRVEVVARLKEIAGKEQALILDAFDSPKSAKALWIVNAVMVNLTAEQIGEAAAMDAVKYVYPGYRAPRNPNPGGKKVAPVLKPAERKPFEPTGKKIPWNLKEIGAEKVWTELKITGEGVVVAMLDAGVKVDHEDLKSNIWINEKEVPNNGKDDDENGYVDDYYGYNFVYGTPDVSPNPKARMQHGTLTSGIVAGDGTGGTVTGVAPRAKIMPLMGFANWAAFAYQYALESGADVLNMSFSLPNLGSLRGFWRMMSDHAVCAGLVLVSGAGNFQQQQKIPVQIRIPEGIPSVICAGGVDREMKVPSFCSLGPVDWSDVEFFKDHPFGDGEEGLIKPDVCGFPGPNYPVIWPRKGKGYIDPNKGIQGNSFSSPHISGTVALMLSANPELTAWRVKEILEETAKDIDPPGKDARTGAGLADAYAAVKKAIAEKK